MITFISSAAGVPILIGSFVAGVLVAQTIEHYHIFSQIRPLRDLMAIIFFVFIGTKVNLISALPFLPQIILFGLLVVLIKGIILISVFLYFRFNSRIAFSLALFLFQISETAFILLSLAFANKVFTQEQYLFVTITVLISLMVTPLFIGNKDTIYSVIRTFFKKYIPSVELFIKHRLDFDPSRLEAFNIENHVVICGYGRVGSHVGKALTLANIPFVAIDYNFSTVEKIRKSGVKIIYGDPTDYDVLDFAETDKALAIVSAVPAKFDQESIILSAKKLKPDIFIIGRAQNAKDHQRMLDLGVQAVVQPEIEASISIIKKIFLLKNMPKDEILKRLKHIRLVQIFA
jgi:CPA2 family monovalent cation:H+ antiporter-2